MAAKTSRSPARPPSHPGSILREIVLPESRMAVSKAAERLGVTRQTLHRLLAEDIGVSPAMALRLSRLFGSTPDFWLRMQQSYDLWHAARLLGPELKKIMPLGRAA